MPRSRRRPVASDRRFRSQRLLADHGTQERWQHSGRTLEPTERQGVLAAKATEEHIIDTLVMRGVITARQREAAFRFKLDYQSAALTAHVTSSYNPLSGGGDYNPQGRRARRRRNRRLSALAECRARARPALQQRRDHGRLSRSVAGTA